MSRLATTTPWPVSPASQAGVAFASEMFHSGGLAAGTIPVPSGVTPATGGIARSSSITDCVAVTATAFITHNGRTRPTRPCRLRVASSCSTGDWLALAVCCSRVTSSFTRCALG